MLLPLDTWCNEPRHVPDASFQITVEHAAATDFWSLSDQQFESCVVQPGTANKSSVSVASDGVVLCLQMD